MDRYELFIFKLRSIDQFNHGAILLGNPEIALTTMANGFIQYLLSDWALPLNKNSAEADAERVRLLISDSNFFKLDPYWVKSFYESDDGHLLPILAIRWLMRNAHVSVIIPYMSELPNFTSRYHDILSRLDGKQIVR